VRQPAPDDLICSSVRTGGQTCPPMCSAKEQHLSGGHGTTVRRKPTPDHTVRVLATNLISRTATVLALHQAGSLAEVQQRIIPKLRQDGYEFQLEEFIETVEGTQGPDGSQAMVATLNRNGDGAGLGR
jgi:hypothetical protein